MQSYIQTVARCLEGFRDKANTNDLLDTVDRVQEQIQKQLDADASL